MKKKLLSIAVVFLVISVLAGGALAASFNCPFSVGNGLAYNTMDTSLKSSSAYVKITAVSSDSLLDYCGFIPYVAYNGAQVSNPGTTMTQNGQ